MSIAYSASYYVQTEFYDRHFYSIQINKQYGCIF